MNSLLRTTPWLAIAVALYQVGVFVVMMLDIPSILLMSIIVMVPPLLASAAAIFVFDVVLELRDRTAAGRSRRAASWMMLSCLPLWPALLQPKFGADLWGDILFGIVVVAILVRTVSVGHARWIIPLTFAVSAAVLSLSAAELTGGCVLVAVALALHAVAVMPRDRKIFVGHRVRDDLRAGTVTEVNANHVVVEWDNGNSGGTP